MKWTIATIALLLVGVWIYYEWQVGNINAAAGTDPAGGLGVSDVSTNLATAIGIGIQKMEGFFGPGQYGGNPAGSLSYRNNNPGNIIGSGDAGSDGPYAVFSSYDAGFSALQNLISRYLTNHPGWTLQQMVDYYVNGNSTSTAQNAVNYARGLADQLTAALGFTVTPDTTIADLQQAAA